MNHMANQEKQQKPDKPSGGFWKRLMESLDKKLEEKARKSACCQGREGKDKCC